MANKNWPLAIQIEGPTLQTLPLDLATESRSTDLDHDRNALGRMITHQSHDLERFYTSMYSEIGRSPQSRNTSKNPTLKLQLPSPRIDSIQDSQMNFAMACIHNARSMGFIPDTNDKDNMAAQCLSLSPLYRSVKPSDDPRELLATVTKPSTPVHLIPTLPRYFIRTYL